MASPSLSAGFGTPFDAQIEFLRQKLRLPTERWDDILRAAHDRAFIVAGAAKVDLLADLHAAVIKAAEGGAGLQAFQRDFRAIVAKHGWTGWTGEGTKEGEAWRTRVIYQTNMATSYAAGRRAQMSDPEVLKLHPYWRYIHSDGVLNPRPLHLEWHGLTLLASHPFWETHYPPCGWGCHCRVVSVTRKEGEASARAGLGEPPTGWDAINPKTGAPVGIDKGFDYAPGASVKRPLQELIDAKLINLNAPLGAQVWESVKPVLQQERLAQWQATFDATRGGLQAGGNAVQVHTVAPAIVAALAERKVALENAAVWMRDTELMHALRDTKAVRGAAMPESVWRDLPLQLEAASVYLDTDNNTLLYVVDMGERVGKVIVRVNYNEKGRFDGVRGRIVSNFVVTGGMANAANMNESRYVPLSK
ncbi:MAG: phage minor head protein [Polaromonas sp.]|nr:phage minor head protein [Polaromonas sp.]